MHDICLPSVSVGWKVDSTDGQTKPTKFWPRICQWVSSPSSHSKLYLQCHKLFCFLLCFCLKSTCQLALFHHFSLFIVINNLLYFTPTLILLYQTPTYSTLLLLYSYSSYSTLLHSTPPQMKPNGVSMRSGCRRPSSSSRCSRSSWRSKSEPTGSPRRLCRPSSARPRSPDGRFLRRMPSSSDMWLSSRGSCRNNLNRYTDDLERIVWWRRIKHKIV